MERKSLDEINGSVDVPNVYQSAFWQKFLAYSGPGALVNQTRRYHPNRPRSGNCAAFTYSPADCLMVI